MDIFLYSCITTNKIRKLTLIYNRLLSVWFYSYCVNNLLQQKDAVQNYALHLVLFCLFNLEESLSLSLTLMSTLQASYFSENTSVWICPIFPYWGMHRQQKYHLKDAVSLSLLLPRWHMNVILPFTSDVLFDHLIKVVSAKHLREKVTHFPLSFVRIWWGGTLKL